MASLTFEQWLAKAGYSKDWYNKLDVMHQMQVEQTYQDHVYNDGDVQSVTARDKIVLSNVAAGKAASEPTKAQEATLKPPTPQQAARQVQQNQQASDTVTSTYGVQPGADINDILAAMPPDQADILRQNASILQDPAKASAFVQNWQAQQSSIYNLPMGWANQQVMLARPATSQDVAPGKERQIEQKDVNAGGNVGAQWTSAIGAMFAPGLWNDQSRVQNLQDQMAKAGYAATTDFIHPGQYDEITRKAYTNVIQDAIAEHKTIQEVLDEGAVSFAKQQAKQRGDFLSARQSVENPFVAPALTTDDPKKVMATVQADFQQAVGRKPTANELKALTATYRQYEARQNQAVTAASKYQNEATNQGNLYQFDLAHQADERKYGVKPEGAPNMPAAPTIQTFDPQAEAAAQARALAPNEAGGQDLRTAFDGFIKAIQGP